MTMTNPQDTIADTARRGQEAVTSALQIWADSVQKLVGSLPTPDARVPRADEVVDQVFGFAEQMLVTQREFTKSVLAATTSAATNVASAATNTANAAASNAEKAAQKKS
jgi:hypothetical protein